MESNFELNDVTKKLPKHLHKFIVRQPYEEYTPQNQKKKAFNTGYIFDSVEIIIS